MTPRERNGPAMTDAGHHDAHGTTATAEDPLAALRFEKQELAAFVTEDQGAGVAIGQLLAFIFCILLVLMTSVTYWTALHQNQSDDPHHTVSSGETHAGH